MANTICIHGKLYPVIHKKIEKNHDFSKTYYDYIVDRPTLNRLENAEKSVQIYQEKYERLQKFVNMYNIDDSEIDKRLRENQK